MKYGLLFLFAFMCVGFMGIGGCTPEAVSSSGAEKSISGPLVLDESQAGKPAVANIGQIVEMRLKGNATTGYKWIVTAVNTFSTESAVVLERVGETYQPDDQVDKKVVGSGGTYCIKFKAVGKGKAKVILQYLRPWEGQASAGKTLSFEITVGG